MGGNQARAREIWVHRADDGVILNEPIFIPPFIHLYYEFEKPYLFVVLEPSFGGSDMVVDVSKSTEHTKRRLGLVIGKLFVSSTQNIRLSCHLMSLNPIFALFVSVDGCHW